jgi:hypothetical protein
VSLSRDITRLLSTVVKYTTIGRLVAETAEAFFGYGMLNSLGCLCRVRFGLWDCIELFESLFIFRLLTKLKVYLCSVKMVAHSHSGVGIDITVHSTSSALVKHHYRRLLSSAQRKHSRSAKVTDMPCCGYWSLAAEMGVNRWEVTFSLLLHALSKPPSSGNMSQRQRQPAGLKSPPRCITNWIQMPKQQYRCIRPLR